MDLPKSLVQLPDMDNAVMRPDQIGMRLADELTSEAQFLKDAYADGNATSAYEHLTNVAATTAELMRGFGLHETEYITLKPLPTPIVEEDE